MTKEELKQEAEEWLCNNLHSASEEDFIKAMVDIAEPREKRIAELEAQIEKMKSCENCAFFKDKTYDICHRIKKLGTRRCAFYKNDLRR